MRLRFALTVFLIVSLFLSFLPALLNIPFFHAVKAQGWLSGFTYRQSHVVNGTGTTADANYTVWFNVYRGAGTSSGNNLYLNNNNASTFPYDLNFTASDGTTVLPKWVEDYNSSWAKVWIRVTGNLTDQTQTIYAYYGKSGVTTMYSDGDAVFEFFDDFSGSNLDTTKWATVETGDPVWTVSNGVLTITTDDVDDEATAWAKQNTFGDAAIRTRMKYGGSGAGDVFRIFCRGQSLTAQRSGVAYFAYPASSTYKDNLYNYEGAYYIAQDTVSSDWANFHVYDFLFEGQDYVARQDGAVVVSGTDSGANQLTSGYVGLNSQRGDADSVWDWFLVRKYVDPEPSHGSWENEESAPVNSVAQNYPSNGATVTSWTVEFNYSVTFYDTPKNACIRIFNSTDNSLLAIVWNSTTLLNGTSVNYGDYTFSIEQDYKWDCIYYSNTGSSWQTSANWTFTVDVAPRWQNVGQNATSIDVGGAIKLYAQGYDGIGLNRTWLATNETGTWKNYTLISFSAENSDNYTVSTYGYLAENIVYDNVTDKYWWIFSDYNTAPKEIKIAWATEINGTWTIQGTVISDSTNDVYAPQLVKFDGYWYIYYSNGTSTTGCTVWAQRSLYVNHSYSTSGIENPLLTTGSAGSWDDRRVSEPYVHYFNGTYYMLFMGEDEANLYEQTGLAISNYPNQSFSKYENNPVLPTDGYPHGWDNGQDRAADPFILEYGSNFVVGVTACVSGKTNWTIGFYITYDFITYEHYDGNPVLGHGAAGSWDDQKVLRGAVTKFGDVYYFPYTGHDGTGYRLGLTNLTISWTYGSPVLLNTENTWVWANFTWTNSSIPSGTTIQWKIYFEDSYGNINATTIQSFTVGAQAYTYSFTETISPSAMLSVWQAHSYAFSESSLQSESFSYWVESHYKLSEFSSVSGQFGQWQERSSDFVQTLLLADASGLKQENIYVYTVVVASSHGVVRGVEVLYRLQQSVQMVVSKGFWEEQWWVGMESLYGQSSLQRWVENKMDYASVLGISGNADYPVEMLFARTVEISSDGTVVYMQEQRSGFTEFFQFTSFAESLAEGVTVFSETFSESVPFTDTLNAWGEGVFRMVESQSSSGTAGLGAEGIFAFAESASASSFLSSLGEALYNFAESLAVFGDTWRGNERTVSVWHTITPEESKSYALEVVYSFSCSTSANSALDVLMEQWHVLSQSFMIDGLSEHATELMYYFYVFTEAFNVEAAVKRFYSFQYQVGQPSAGLVVIALAIAFGSLTLLLKWRQEIVGYEFE